MVLDPKTDGILNIELYNHGPLMLFMPGRDQRSHFAIISDIYNLYIFKIAFIFDRNNKKKDKYYINQTYQYKK